MTVIDWSMIVREVASGCVDRFKVLSVLRDVRGSEVELLELDTED
jgi:hypothetical protein